MKRVNFWFLAGLTFLISGFIALSNLDEFVKIGLLKKTNGYPFGGEGLVPWYYKTAEIYAGVNLFFGLLFLITLIFALWTTFKKKKNGLLISFLVTILILAIQFINGQIN